MKHDVGSRVRVRRGPHAWVGATGEVVGVGFEGVSYVDYETKIRMVRIDRCPQPIWLRLDELEEVAHEGGGDGVGGRGRLPDEEALVTPGV